MTEEQIRARMQSLLLEEVKSGAIRKWYYISVTGKEFHGGFVIRAHGPTDAWRLLHSLGFYPRGTNAETLTTEIPADLLEKIPDDQRWRKLTYEESMNLGKEKE